MQVGPTRLPPCAHHGIHGALHLSIMRKLALSLLVAVTGTSFGIACSSQSEEEVGEGVDNLTRRELAEKALTIMGAPQLPQ